MKRKLWWWFTFSPVIVAVLWILVSLVFRVVWATGDASAVGLLDVIKTFINRWLWLLALLSIPLLIIGIVFLSTSDKNNSKKFTVKEIVKHSRTLAKKHMGKFILWFALYCILQIISNIFGYSEQTGQVELLNIIVTSIVLLGGLWLSLWYKNLSLNIVNEAKAKYSDVFVDFQKFLKYLWAYILVYIIIIIGVILLIVPWVIFALRLSMVPYLILDKNIGPIQAIKMSRKMTKWFIGDIFLLCILIWLINILWFIAILVGLLRTLPLGFIASAYIYKKILAAQNNKETKVIEKKETTKKSKK
ncbi:MAG: hypothetical protein ACD_80C00097G0014 [uncultured bacterium (gcode 4)]|uniref:Integral membrane protein n=1 Tax=uncultured bacterium (gcode 4) TaxID=1234023 RepID=K1XJ81_9BACT|nr:MAG: hypothetical protein ACD_80C00097G0014 [uncultured bacterium (gcode 4)]